MQYKSFKTQRRNTVLKLWFLWRKDPTKKHQLILKNQIIKDN